MKVALNLSISRRCALLARRPNSSTHSKPGISIKKGLLDGLLIEKSLSTASLSVAIARRPYIVSVGKQTIPPSKRRSAASSKALFVSFFTFIPLLLP